MSSCRRHPRKPDRLGTSFPDILLGTFINSPGSVFVGGALTLPRMEELDFAETYALPLDLLRKGLSWSGVFRRWHLCRVRHRSLACLLLQSLSLKLLAIRVRLDLLLVLQSQLVDPLLLLLSPFLLLLALRLLTDSQPELPETGV